MNETNEGFQPGLMMDSSLTITSILRRAAQFFPEKEIVSRLSDGSIHRTTYGDLYRRVARLMHALRALGVRPGDLVATFAWNSYRHLELYFAVPCLGAILHTLNIRLFPDQLAYIINHAEDKWIFADKSLAGALSPLQSELKTVDTFVIMDDRGEAGTAPPTGTLDYEELLVSAAETEAFPDFDEKTAAILCYTSGTTGEPKGVLFSHRSLYLHTMGCCMADSLAIREREVVLPVVPMFHANAWGLPFACAMAGAKQVLPGSRLVGGPLAELIVQERVTWAAGVPTVWNLLYQYLMVHPCNLSRLKTIVVGGAALPRVLIENYQRDFGITMVHAWGMTETSPVGSVCNLKAAMDDWPEERRLDAQVKQGIPVANLEVRLEGEHGEELPWDGEHSGELLVRGPWVSRAYYKCPDTNTAFTEDGWFRTGDIATVDSSGYLEITDRKKDIIKSRGEWISSVDMENAVMACPGVLEAAVVGRSDDLRGEAPVVFVVPRQPETEISVQEVLDLLKGQFARWQLPRLTDIHVVASLPKTAVGKLDKKAIRRNLTG